MVEFCTGCGQRLAWGKFAYKQEICWECFEQQVLYITTQIKTVQNKEIVLHLLGVAKETHGIR